ncbi:hypothetical protein [Sporohalobacter salinus]|uniref:hypothetical protein n=1 Tax=Sporohalobacter salinus TaxID=1494606 RepID=UPI0019600D6F|nr:hypothetical protein [Sporohalobacter salinus]MBM7623614.1 uncharacterized membrane-anchored protein YhcB (DUF1043 family) [Sporohalobacter salinus]
MKWIIGFIVLFGIGVLFFMRILKRKLKNNKEVEIKSDDKVDQTDDIEVVRENMFDGIKEDK